MQARFSEQAGVVVVELIGKMDVEAAVPFREACLKRLSGRKVVFDLRALSFVGSSGIVPLLESILGFAERAAAGVTFSGAGPEFRKILSATALQAFGAHETAVEAAHFLASVEGQARAARAAPIAVEVRESLFGDATEGDAPSRPSESQDPV